MDLSAIAQRYQSEVNAEIGILIEGHTMPLYNMLRYHLGWSDSEGRPVEGVGGKGIRSSLCLLACAAVGGHPETAMPAAAALELVHNFSLIHDDIQDESPQRRHRPTVWRLWGVAQAINAGDSMYTLARIALYRLKEHGVSPRKIMSIARVLDKACLKLCEGQYLDLTYQTKAEVTIPDYVTMIGSKTGTLLGAALQMGAMVGTSRPRIASQFYKIGVNLGLAFQIQDDILGIWGDESQTGKGVGEDIRSKKKSLPVIYALQQSRGAEREAFLTIYDKPELDQADVAVIMDMLNKCGAREYSRERALEYFDQAIAELDRLGLSSSAVEEMKVLCSFLVERAF